MPQGFVRRMTTSVVLLFLFTMAGFLWIAYRSERNAHYRETFDRLAETARVAARLPRIAGKGRGDDLLQWEHLLAGGRGGQQRILITDSSSSVIASTQGDHLGRDIRELYSLPPTGPTPADTLEATGTSPSGERWLIVSVPLDADGDRLYLLRPEIDLQDFAGRFARIHGLHLGVTVLLFLVMLRFLGRRFVQRPIEQLAQHVRRIESGEFQTRPEVYRDDEFGWLADRFSRMGQRLSETIQRQVRSEKAATAAVMAYRVVRESSEPLHSLDRHITYLEGIVGQDRDLVEVARSMRDDHQKLASAAGRLESTGQEADGIAGSSLPETDVRQG